MGHDIYCKNCPRPVKSECINFNCNHDTIEEDYISFNHSVNSDIWHVSMAHGHSGRVVSNQLERAIKQMTDGGIVPGMHLGITFISEGWSETPGVFLVHLFRIKAMTDRNPELTFLSDPYWSIKSDPNDSEYNDDDYAYDKTPDVVQTGPVTYYKHPTKGNIKVDNFSTASEILSIMTINEDSRVPNWIYISNQMHDAPIN
jgi:hypothetical protein